jgi:hypothetical protein
MRSQEALSYPATAPESSPPISDNVIEFPGGADTSQDIRQPESPELGQTEPEEARNNLGLVEPRQQEAGDFFTQNDTEHSSGEATESLSEELSAQDKIALDQLGVGYENQNQLQREISLRLEDQNTVLSEYQQIAETLNCDPATLGLNELSLNNPETLETTQQELAETSKYIEKLEAEFLQIQQIAEQAETVGNYIQRYEEIRQRIPDLETLEASVKELRRRAVIDFIKDSHQWISQEFRDYFDQTQNGKRAEKLAQAKMTNAVWFAAQNFIENGGEPNYGFTIGFQQTEYNHTGTPVRHITDIEIETRLGRDTQNENSSSANPLGQTSSLNRTNSAKAA